MFQVKVIAGGPISGPFLREEYTPDQTYEFPDSDRAYVEAAFSSSRFEVVELPDPAPSAPPEPNEKAAKPAKASK